MREAFGEAVIPGQPATVARWTFRAGSTIRHFRAQLVIIIVALLLWAPRLAGPIDLRWDAGVYYLLGTSLANGHGYRIPSEPGAPEALQYPPLLPAVVALHEWVLGSSDPAVVAPWLRKTYAVIFLSYGMAILALAKRHLAEGFALAATLLVLLYSETVFFSDLLYAELPFALVSVLFVLVATGKPLLGRPGLQEAAAFSLATAGVLLRTAGISLLAAWVLEALIHRRWKLAVARGLLALLPIIAWQVHVVQVRASDDYAHPAYDYQRAPYQYNNVSYGDNATLANPFRPEQGRLTTHAFVKRLATNTPRAIAALGETVGAEKDDWRWLLQNAQRRLLGREIIRGQFALLPILFLALLSILGLLIFIYRGAWLFVFVVLGSLLLVWTTPWPNQFIRYLVPLAPFLVLCTTVAVSQARSWLETAKVAPLTKEILRVVILAVLAFALIAQTAGLMRVFRQRGNKTGMSYSGDKPGLEGRFFKHDDSWRDLEAAAAWINRHAPPGTIVATSAPHLFYLLTGRLAVIPPLVSDPEGARHLLQAVPVSYVVIDELKSLDMSRRYARPAVRSDPEEWRLVQSVGGTEIYERARSPR